MTFTKTNLFNIYFIGLVTLIGTVATPTYIFYYGISRSEVILLILFMFLTGFSVTVGYHRLFAHVSYRTNRVIRFLFLFFGAGAFQQSALAWSSQHRDHHRYVDTDADPYNINKGFFWAHMGWLFFGKYHFIYTNVDDLSEDRLVMNQARYYPLWSLTAGVLLPTLIGALAGRALGGFIIGVGFRIFLVHHLTWCINSVCHTFGKRTYDTNITARDNWITSFVTFGEGFHNFHHRFPGDYRNGVKWYHWDPSKWIIFSFEKLGLATKLRRTSELRILEAKLAAGK